MNPRCKSLDLPWRISTRDRGTASVLDSTPVMLTGRVCLTMRHTRKMGKTMTMMTNYGMEWGTVLYPILAILRQNYNHFKSDVAVAGLFQAKMARISF